MARSNLECIRLSMRCSGRVNIGSGGVQTSSPECSSPSTGYCCFVVGSYTKVEFRRGISRLDPPKFKLVLSGVRRVECSHPS